MNFKDLHPKNFFFETWRQIDEESFLLKKEDDKKDDGFVALVVFVVAAISLTLQYYWGSAHVDNFSLIIEFIDNPFSSHTDPFLWFWVKWLKPDDVLLRDYLINTGYLELLNLCYWTAWRVLGFLVIPVIVIIIHPNMSLKNIGLSTQGFTQHIWIYILLFFVVLIAVVIVSFFSEFSSYYPFYVFSTRSRFDFWSWELLYVLQFFSLEFFFRGFLLQPLKRSMGSVAIFAMTIPYVMIHYDKPMIECFGAIVAGIVLGTLAMRTRSIWAGFLIHVSVALSMDVAANLQNYGLPWLLSLVRS